MIAVNTQGGCSQTMSCGAAKFDLLLHPKPIDALCELPASAYPY